MSNDGNKKTPVVGKRDYQPVGFVPDISLSTDQKEQLVGEAFSAIREGMVATKRTYATHRGQITDSVEEPDMQARLRAAELAGQFTGLRQSTKEVRPVVHITIATPAWAVEGSPRVVNPTESQEGSGHDQPD